MLANIRKGIFGGALVRAPAGGRPKIGALPSLEDLRCRVLLKAKNPHVSESEPLEARGITTGLKSSETTSTSDQDVLSDIKSELLKVKTKVLGHVGNHHASFGEHSWASPPITSKTSSNNDEKDKKVKMPFDLLALLVYTASVKCKGINRKENYAPKYVFSLSENTANRLDGPDQAQSRPRRWDLS